jgi:hypothetical protein
MKKLSILWILFFACFSLYAQDSTAVSDSVEIDIIDSYVTPEIPHTFMLSFFTSCDCKSKVIIDNHYNYTVSDNFADDHKIKVDLTKLEFKKRAVPYVIVVTDSLGHTYKSEQNEFYLPEQVKVQEESNFMLLCLFGGMVFALPAPSYAVQNGKGYFSLTKDIPLVSFRSKNFSYPLGYFSAEYTYIFNAPNKNLLRIGYKELIDVPGIQYVSPGISWFTNFKGFNGVGPEISLGLFRVLDTFTLYARYRYNIKPGNSKDNFQEISLGLYSSFFSIYF